MDQLKSHSEDCKKYRRMRAYWQLFLKKAELAIQNIFIAIFLAYEQK